MRRMGLHRNGLIRGMDDAVVDTMIYVLLLIVLCITMYEEECAINATR